MLFTLRLWAALGLLATWAEGIRGPAIHTPYSPSYDPSSSQMTTCTSEHINSFSTSSIYYSDTTIDSTAAFPAPPPMNTSTTVSTACFNSTVTTTIIMSIVSTEISTTTSTTTTTDIITDTITDTVTDTITDTVTDTVTDTTTDTTTDITTDTTMDTTTDTTTDTATVTTTDTTTDTIIVPTTITAAPNPCPTTCSMSVGTVNLFYWPTNQPDRIYPSTYVDSHLDYTFTSPSVYMVVNTIYGYNTAGRTGPSGTSVVFPLDLNQVSTIDTVNSATRQLTLNDLGTDCPQSEDPSVIATAAPNGRCDPILVAPEPVKSWASPCNACGNFGLFDPPYAVSPLAGGLVPATTTVAMTKPETTSSVVSATDTTTTMSVTTESTSSSSETSLPVTASSPSIVVTTSSETEGSFGLVPTPVSSSTDRASTASSSSSSSVSTPATTSEMYNTAIKATGRGGWLGLSFFALAFLL